MKVKSKNKSFNLSTGREMPKKVNPFEVHINRSKHQVLGRKLKSDSGLPGVSRNKALQKRKKTLLQEYKMRGKNNQFIDQRIGEKNRGMTEDDRIMARFTAERVRMFNKKAIFNLSDSEVLTHRGQTLVEIEKFEDTRSDDEEDDDPGKSGSLKKKFVENAHFGGGMLTKNKQDRESLIDELINESKKRKAERQRNKEETLEATEQLDEDWKVLGQIVTAVNKDTAEETMQKKDSYDIVMRQLKFEPQAQASQRLKTDEELAKEDKEQLEQLENERLKQLREIEASKYGNHRSADDLDDGFSYSVDGLNDKSVKQKNETENVDASSESEEETNNEENNDEESEEESGSNYEDENEAEQTEQPMAKKCKKEIANDYKLEIVNDEVSEEDDIEIKNDDQTFSSENPSDSSDEDCAMDDLTDLMPNLNHKTENDIVSKNIPNNIESKESMHSMEDTPTRIELDIPYVINMPESYEAFRDFLNKHSVQQQSLIFDRLIKTNHPRLEPGNKQKILKLTEYIIQLVSEADAAWESLPNLVIQMSFIKEFNKEESLKMLLDGFLNELDKLKNADLSCLDMKYLVWYIMLFIRPQGMDVLLSMGQPALCLICKVLSQLSLTSLEQGCCIVIGLLCCFLLLQDTKTSSIVYIEPITFLRNCINLVVKENKYNQDKIKQKDPSENATQANSDGNFKLFLTDCLKVFNSIGSEKEGAALTSHQVLHSSVVLLSGFVKAYRKYPQSKILFKSVLTSCSQIKASLCPPQLKDEVNELQMLFNVNQSVSLPRLTKITKRPKALRQYEPSFHTVTAGKSDKGLPAEKQEEQKLLHKYKHEMKGAMRELRRDRVFLANVKLKEKADSDMQRIKKVKEILGSAANQQGELRKLKRKK